MAARRSNLKIVSLKLPCLMIQTTLDYRLIAPKPDWLWICAPLPDSKVTHIQSVISRHSAHFMSSEIPKSITESSEPANLDDLTKDRRAIASIEPLNSQLWCSLHTQGGETRFGIGRPGFFLRCWQYPDSNFYRAKAFLAGSDVVNWRLAEACHG